MSNLTKVAQRGDIEAGKGKCVSANGQSIALFNLGGQFYAIDDACSHAGGSLSEGEVNGTKVTCPWHGAIFEITTGAVLDYPASEAVKKYNVHIQGDDILLEL